MVTHDPQIASCSNKTVILKDGKISDSVQCEGDKYEYYDKIIRHMKKPL